MTFYFKIQPITIITIRIYSFRQYASLFSWQLNNTVSIINFCQIENVIILVNSLKFFSFCSFNSFFSISLIKEKVNETAVLIMIFNLFILQLLVGKHQFYLPNNQCSHFIELNNRQRYIYLNMRYFQKHNNCQMENYYSMIFLNSNITKFSYYYYTSQLMSQDVLYTFFVSLYFQSDL